MAGTIGLLALVFAGCALNQKERLAYHVYQFKGDIVKHPEDAPVLQSSRSNLVALLGLDAKGKRSYLGTGFYISSNQVMTCLHVIDEAHGLFMQLADGREYPVAGVFGDDPLMDAAVLWVTNPPPLVTPLKLREKPAQLAEPVFALSALTNLTFQTTQGHVIDFLEEGDPGLDRALVLSTPVVPGFSGGPVLDKEGEVVGIASQCAVTPEQNLCLAIPIPEIATLGQETPMAFAEWRQRHPVLPPEVAKAMAKASPTTRPQAALAQYKKALALMPKYVPAWTGKARCLFLLNRKTEAMAAMQTAVNLQPQKVFLRLALLSLCSKNDRPREAAEQAQAIIALRPRQPLGYAALSEARYEEDDYAAAFAAARQAVAFSPEQADGHRAMGELCNNLGLPELAVDHFQEAARLRPDDASLWLQLGIIQWELRRDDEAVQSFHRVLEKKWTVARSGAHYLLFCIALQKNDREAAAREFEAFIDDERTLLRRTGAYEGMQSYLTVAKMFGWKSAVAHESLGELFRFTGREVLRSVAMDLGTQLAPDNSRFWVARAEWYVSKARFEKARVAAETAVKLKPKLASAWFLLGYSEATLGETNAARVAFEKSLAVGGEKSGPLMGLASLQAKSGNEAAAQELVRRANKVKNDWGERYKRVPRDFILNAAEIRQAATVAGQDASHGRN